MITFHVCLLPYGDRRFKKHLLLKGSAWIIDTPAGEAHQYLVELNDGRIIASGEVPRHQSGHRNPAHFMQSIFARIDLESLGKDYVATDMDRLGPDAPDYRARELAAERVSDIVDQIRGLAALGPAGIEAVETIRQVIDSQILSKISDSSE